MTGRGKIIVAVAVGALLLGRAQFGDTPAAQTLPVQELRNADAEAQQPQVTRRPEGERRNRPAAKPRQSSAPKTSSAPPKPRRVVTPPEPRQRDQWTVVNVVDGDTLDVQRGNEFERVRVIGIDTPERGDCGFGDASSALSQIVLGSDVELTPGAVDDRDRYGRLLRYVDVGGRDAGLALVEAGLAIARYDSRDGYGAHPREAAYVSADAATPSSVCGEDPGAPIAVVPPPAAGEAFANCSEARAAGAAPLNRGDSGYGSHLDGDNDGVGCE